MSEDATVMASPSGMFLRKDDTPQLAESHTDLLARFGTRDLLGVLGERLGTAHAYRLDVCSEAGCQ